MKLWRMEWSRTLRQREQFAFLLVWLVVLVMLGGLGQAVPTASEYTNIAATLITVIGLLLPLFVLLTTALYWGQETESKRLRLISTYGFPRWQLILLRYSTYMATQCLVMVFAFASASLVVRLSIETWLYLFCYGVGITAYAAALGTCVGIFGKTRLRSMLYAFFVWVIAVLLWPTILVSVIAWLPYGQQVPAMMLALFVNGFDALRVWTSLMLSSPDRFGVVYVNIMTWLDRWEGTVLMWSAVVGASLFFLMLASNVMKRGEARD